MKKIFLKFMHKIVFLFFLILGVPSLGFGMNVFIDSDNEEEPVVRYADEDDFDDAFLSAAKEGNFDVMKEALSAGADINAKDIDTNKTALHYVIPLVAENKISANVIDWLLDHNANTKIYDADLESPLDCAWQEFCFNIVLKILIHDDGIDKSALRWVGTSGYDYTVYRFILERDVEGLNNFFEACATQVGLDSFTPVYPISPLMLACYLGDIEIVESLILHGAHYVDFEEENRGLEPLFIAIGFGYVHIVKFFLTSFPDLKNKKINSFTPLYFAFDCWQFNVAETMLESRVPFDFFSKCLCEGILNGQEGDLSPDRKIYLRFLMRRYGGHNI